MNRTDLPRLARTVAHLRPAQIGQRVRLRGQRAALQHGFPMAERWLLSGPDETRAPGWPATFVPLDAGLWRDWAQAPALLAGSLSLLGVTRPLAPTGSAGAVEWTAADWTFDAEPLLWRFHAYYWDWAWGLAAAEHRDAARDCFPALWKSWTATTRPGRGVSWLSYPAALRAWSLCGVYPELVRGGAAAGPVRCELSALAGFLRRNLETDVGGNHLLKDLKALIGLAVFFGDSALLARTVGWLRRQLNLQVLPDGGHYERAPAYHCQVLGDLIDVAGLLAAAGAIVPRELPAAIAAMRQWLGLVVTPDGQVPLLNDGYPVSRDLLAALRPDAPRGGALRVLKHTGLARAAVGPWHLLADIGPPCPPGLPAHAHADTLGCLLFVDSEPLLVDTGTTSYAPGPARDHERSTAAHNTVELDGTNSTEVWGAFRAGRRARVSALTAGETNGAVLIEAAHDGYRNLTGRPTHQRRWLLSTDELCVTDTVTGAGRHRVTVRWHLAPGTELQLSPGGPVITMKSGDIAANVHSDAGCQLRAETARIAAGFGLTADAPLLMAVVDAELPVRITTTWRRAGHGSNLP